MLSPEYIECCQIETPVFIYLTKDELDISAFSKRSVYHEDSGWGLYFSSPICGDVNLILLKHASF